MLTFYYNSLEKRFDFSPNTTKDQYIAIEKIRKVSSLNTYNGFSHYSDGSISASFNEGNDQFSVTILPNGWVSTRDLCYKP